MGKGPGRGGGGGGGGTALSSTRGPQCSEMNARVQGCVKSLEEQHRKHVELMFRDRNLVLSSLSKSQALVYRTMLRVHKEKKMLEREQLLRRNRDAAGGLANESELMEIKEGHTVSNTIIARGPNGKDERNRSITSEQHSRNAGSAKENELIEVQDGPNENGELKITATEPTEQDEHRKSIRNPDGEPNEMKYENNVTNRLTTNESNDKDEHDIFLTNRLPATEPKVNIERKISRKVSFPGPSPFRQDTRRNQTTPPQFATTLPECCMREYLQQSFGQLSREGSQVAPLGQGGQRGQGGQVAQLGQGGQRGQGYQMSQGGQGGQGSQGNQRNQGSQMGQGGQGSPSMDSTAKVRALTLPQLQENCLTEKPAKGERKRHVSREETRGDGERPVTSFSDSPSTSQASISRASTEKTHMRRISADQFPTYQSSPTQPSTDRSPRRLSSTNQPSTSQLSTHQLSTDQSPSRKSSTEKSQRRQSTEKSPQRKSSTEKSPRRQSTEKSPRRKSSTNQPAPSQLITTRRATDPFPASLEIPLSKQRRPVRKSLDQEPALVYETNADGQIVAVDAGSKEYQRAAFPIPSLRHQHQQQKLLHTELSAAQQHKQKADRFFEKLDMEDEERAARYRNHLSKLAASKTLQPKPPQRSGPVTLSDLAAAFHQTHDLPEGVDPNSLEALTVCQYVRKCQPLLMSEEERQEAMRNRLSSWDHGR